jgi:hypothetical protein
MVESMKVKRMKRMMRDMGRRIAEGICPGHAPMRRLISQ